ncbi:MAG: CHASE3 domain-containing protein [Bryobacterales bacterium]|nr:CHASE3 domain-containing protein [Bryobacterales bacterium]
MRWTFAIKLGLAIWLGLLANVLVSGIASYRGAIRLIETNQSVQHTYSLLAEFEQADSAISAVETGVRDFLLSGDTGYLDPYRAAVPAAEQSLVKLRSLAARHHEQQEDLRGLATLLEEALALSGKQVASRANRSTLSGDVGKQVALAREKTNRIRELLGRMKETERTLLFRRQKIAEESAEASIRVVFFGTALALLLGILAGAAIFRNFSNSVATLKRGAELIGAGNLSYRIDTGNNDEFADLAAVLNNMAGQLGRARDELLRQVGLTEAILQSIGDGVAVINEHGEFLIYNHAACRISGIPEGRFPAAISGRYGCILHEDNLCPVPVEEMPLARAARGELVDETIVGIRPPPPDGDNRGIRWVHVTARPLRDGQGALTGAVAVMTDITEQRTAFQELKIRERLLRSVIEAMPVGVCIAGPDGAIGMINAAGTALWGDHRESSPYGEVKAWHWRTGDPVLAREWVLKRAILNGETILQELIGIQTPGHSRKAVLLSAVPLRDSSGNLNGAIEVGEDITARISIEEELSRANKELEAFSYSVSHDLRAPLRHIDGFSGLLEKYAGSRLDEKARRYLDTISASAREMGKLIDDLLAFSRMGRTELMSTPVSMDGLLRDALDELASETAGRALEWEIGALPPVHGDPAMLRLVLVNLVSNAIKYTRYRAMGRIGVAGYRDGAEAVFRVRDNGVGFDMKYSEKLFGVFQRLHSSKEFEGTGIGLATVRRIIHRHGGRTWAAGTVDEGAAFYFSLPWRNEDSR